jgi:hypothetical protein
MKLTKLQQQCLDDMKNNNIIGTMVGVVSWKLRWEKPCNKSTPLWVTMRSLLKRNLLFMYRDKTVDVHKAERVFTTDEDKFMRKTGWL